MCACNERSVSKIKPAPTNTDLYRYGCSIGHQSLVLCCSTGMNGQSTIVIPENISVFELPVFVDSWEWIPTEVGPPG
jgi:hypothetical protein